MEDLSRTLHYRPTPVPLGRSSDRKSSVNTGRKLVQFMEEQDGEPFDPADCLIRAAADLICGITFKDGSDTTTQS